MCCEKKKSPRLGSQQSRRIALCMPHAVPRLRKTASPRTNHASVKQRRTCPNGSDRKPCLALGFTVKTSPWEVAVATGRVVHADEGLRVSPISELHSTEQERC